MLEGPVGPGRSSGWLPRRELAWRRDGPSLSILALLAAYFLALSWRKWPDPLIDGGRELYTPWRLAQGAVLYRDVDAIYGPLSQTVNAALFRCFGPGLMVLVAANLLVFTAILLLLYGLLRRAFGQLAAIAASGVFVAVFGFSQLSVIGNYNFAFPYAHEVTHGLLVCLLLAVVLERWLQAASPRLSLWAGLLVGLTAVLKPEFMLAGGLVTLAAVVLRGQREGRPGRRCLLAWLTGALLPTLVFTLWFLRELPLAQALAGACRAWLNVVASTSLTGDVIQARYLGLDEPGRHLVEHLRGGSLAFALIAAVGVVARMAGRGSGGWVRHATALAFLAALGSLVWSYVNWMMAGRCLLGLVGAYTLYRVWRLFGAAGKRDVSEAEGPRLLLTLLAAAFMLRMGLNGRFGQYGFWQAALAGALIPAVMLGELPEWIGSGVSAAGAGRVRAMLLAGTLALVGPGVLALTSQSRALLQVRTQPVGEGRDRFYAFPSNLLPTGELVELLVTELRKQPAGDSLLVLPEGVMLNYLARMPSPVAPFFFFSYVTAEGREAELVRQLEARPPTWVAVVTRDLREYGIERYGESPGHGQLLMDWVQHHYDPVGRIGGDPLDVQQFGGIVWHAKASGG